MQALADLQAARTLQTLGAKAQTQRLQVKPAERCRHGVSLAASCMLLPKM